MEGSALMILVALLALVCEKGCFVGMNLVGS